MGGSSSQLAKEKTIESVAEIIKSSEFVCTVAGAGISTSAGIPDFRSPFSGIYDNVKQFNLPHRMAVFDYEYFCKNPVPFFTICKSLWPSRLEPTKTHHFIKLLEEKNKLHHHYTQNIDTLEFQADISPGLITEAHGTFMTGHCENCHKEFNFEWLRQQIMVETVPSCDKCSGVVKPDVVLFGERLPSKFHQSLSKIKHCNIMIIMGTSLVVQPFASIPSLVNSSAYRVYINREKPGSGFVGWLMWLTRQGGHNLDFKNNDRDIFLQGDCDETIEKLCSLLGWTEELEELTRRGKTKADKGTGFEKPLNL